MPYAAISQYDGISNAIHHVMIFIKELLSPMGSGSFSCSAVGSVSGPARRAPRLGCIPASEQRRVSPTFEEGPHCI